MKLLLCTFLCILLLTIEPLSAKLVDLNLKDNNGGIISLKTLASDKKFLVIIAQGNECPVMRQNIPAFNEIQNKYKNDPVLFLMVNGVQNDDFETINKEISDYKIRIPVYKDIDQKILKATGLTILSGVAVINLKSDLVIYRGAISDKVRLDFNKPKASKNYLEDALNSALKNSPIIISETQIYGCTILIK